MEEVFLIQTVVIVVGAWIVLCISVAGLWSYAKWLSKN